MYFCNLADGRELNSTVSKILGETLPDLNLRSPLGHSQPVMPTVGPAEVPVHVNNNVPQFSQPKVQRALLQWTQQNQQAGIHVTRAMIRQKAASLAALSWTEEPSRNILSKGCDLSSQLKRLQGFPRKFAMVTDI